MPVPVVTAEVILDAIKARLDLIVGGGNYNTNPTKSIGVPRDRIPEGSAGDFLYLVHSDSNTMHDEAMGSHKERATYIVWCISNDPVDGNRKALRVVRDVEKAVRSGFQAIMTAGANSGVAIVAYARDERAEQLTGAVAYSLSITADWTVDLTA